MLSQRITGWNATLGAPAGWNPKTDGNCGALVVRMTPPEAARGTVPVQTCESAWEPSPMEMEWLNQGGNVILRVVGWQPPVAVFVEAPEPDVAHKLSAGFARGFATAVGMAASIVHHSPANASALILNLVNRLRVDVRDNPEATIAMQHALKLNLHAHILATAINALQDGDSISQTIAADLRTVAISSELVEVDDLHHAPRCPAWRANGNRLPTGSCLCGARADQEGQPT